MSEATPNDVALAILGAPLVKAMGGVKEIKRRPPTQEEQDAIGPSLRLGDWITFVPNNN